MVTTSSAKEIAQQFVQACVRKNIPIREAILFGSFARGTGNRNSDIDLALIADSFGKNIIVNSKQTALINWEYPDVEVHHFSPEEFQTDDPFIKEIKHTGIKIY